MTPQILVSKNLVYLCFDHHDEYDSQTSQSKGLLLEEVREYRDRLYARYGDIDSIASHASAVTELEPMSQTSLYNTLREQNADRLRRFEAEWRFPLWQVADEPELFAYKSSNRLDGVCLIERIDLPDGRIVVVCIGIAGNPGNSITNSVEHICLQVCERFEIPPERLVWIEHYDFYEESDWNLVSFGKMPPTALFAEPKWTPMTSVMWQELRLRPKSKLKALGGSYESKVTKLFPWPPD